MVRRRTNPVIDLAKVAPEEEDKVQPWEVGAVLVPEGETGTRTGCGVGAGDRGASAAEWGRSADRTTSSLTTPFSLASSRGGAGLAGPAPGRIGNRVLALAAYGAGTLILVLLAGVALFLLHDSLPALTASDEELAEVGFMGGRSLGGYVLPLVYGTLVSSVLALAVAVPLSVGVALFLTHYAPPRAARWLGYLVDLLAAVPSVVFGLWGFLWLVPLLDPLQCWLSSTLGFIPFLAGYQAPAKNLATAGLVLAVMILPIITATVREVLALTPRLQEEACLALGATRAETVRLVVLPFARSGIVSASMLGLGRALGETMAVLMILSSGLTTSLSLLAPGQHQTIAASIASQFREAFGLSREVLLASGLVLFAVTFLVNSLARWAVARRAAGSGGER